VLASAKCARASKDLLSAFALAIDCFLLSFSHSRSLEGASTAKDTVLYLG